MRKRIVENNQYKILTQEGYKDFVGIMQLPKVNTLKFILEDGYSISVSMNHEFEVDGMKCIAHELLEGELLETENGLREIIKIEFLEEKDHIYEVLDVKSSNHTYYADGILNHNCAFLGSSNTLIDPALLERMNTKNPVELKMGSYLNIYEQPIEGAMYILGVDSAKGTRKDYSVIQVLKILNEHNIEQVALYRNNEIDARDFAQVVISVSEFYNQAYIMLENNDVGEQVGNTIWYEYEYDKILNCDKKGIGIRSTRKTKLAANILLKRYVENGWLEILDRYTLYELSRYEEVTPNVFKAPRTGHDDCVTSLLWGLYFLTTVFFDGKNLDVKTIDKRYMVDTISKEDITAPVAIIGPDDENITDDSFKGPGEGWGYGETGDESFMF